MNPFVIKPGETVVGLGINFATRLASGETLSNVAVTASAGITVVASSVDGTTAFANISVDSAQADADMFVQFTATGNAGSIRKGRREIIVRANSD
jgi:hypothetical protein